MSDVETCPAGYSDRDGDIYGNSLEGNIAATLDQCAGHCTTNPHCHSFEYKNNNCNLNKESEPNGPRWEDFMFCSKAGNIGFSTLSLIVVT